MRSVRHHSWWAVADPRPSHEPQRFVALARRPSRHRPDSTPIFATTNPPLPPTIPPELDVDRTVPDVDCPPSTVDVPW